MLIFWYIKWSSNHNCFKLRSLLELDISILKYPTTNVGISNVGVFKRRSCQTQESQTSEWVKRKSESNAGEGQTQDLLRQTSECSFYSSLKTLLSQLQISYISAIEWRIYYIYFSFDYTDMIDLTILYFNLLSLTYFF